MEATLTMLSRGEPRSTTYDLLSTIVAEPDGVARAELIGAFIAATDPLNRSIATALCREFKVDRTTWFDDLCQLVRLAAHALLSELVMDPDRLDEVGSWRGLLTFRARSASTAFLDSSAGFNPASGMAGVKRRVREMEKTRNRLFGELQREPTDQEVVDATNERMAAHRSDYKRQGMECQVADLWAVAPTQGIEDLYQRASRDTVETDCDLHSTERARLIRLCIEACTAESAQLGQIARIWFAPALGEDYDAHPNATEIAAAVGVQPATARAKIARIRRIAQQVARERYGISRGMHAQRPDRHLTA